MSEETESTELVAELVLEETETDETAPKEHHWHKLVALSTLIMALLAAVGGLLSGITAHEAQLEKIEEISALTILEGDRVSVEILKTKHELLINLGEIPNEKELETIRDFEKEIDEKETEVSQDERLAQLMGQTHLVFAISVTIIAAGISISGMSVIVQQKWLWAVGMVLGAVGAVGVVMGIISMLN
jgi:1,4-dihydroxy-2-naphthoate octaprenyltransferase